MYEAHLLIELGPEALRAVRMMAISTFGCSLVLAVGAVIYCVLNLLGGRK